MADATKSRTSPGKFIREVRTETSKVVWSSGRETAMTTLMVMIMTSVLGFFFFGVDSVFAWIVQALFKLV